MVRRDRADRGRIVVEVRVAGGLAIRVDDDFLVGAKSFRQRAKICVVLSVVGGQSTPPTVTEFPEDWNELPAIVIGKFPAVEPLDGVTDEMFGGAGM